MRPTHGSVPESWAREERGWRVEAPSAIRIGSSVALRAGGEAARLRFQVLPSTIAPAERFDAVIDFSKYPVGTKVTLKNHLGNGTTSWVMRFHLVRKEKEESTVPKRLSDMGAFEALSESGARLTRKFSFTRGAPNGQVVWTINGEVFDPSRISARPKLGSTEIWEFVTDLHHPVHLHLVHFKVLSRNGRRPLPKDAGWKDTVDVLPGQVVRVISRFDGYRGKYVFHCHNLEHEDMMMMSNFGVV
jgi:spore coat protein A, manganese oxidase